MAQKKKKKAEGATVDAAIASIRKLYGADAIRNLGDQSIADVETISTRCIGLDYALGVRGIARGRITEIYGAESSGKTTITLHLIAEAQKRRLVAAFVDAEHALDPTYAQALGVDLDTLKFVQPNSAEEGLNIVETLVPHCGIIVVDSVAALTPQKELEGEMGDSHVGLHARLMSQALRKLAGIVSKTGCALVFINQTRVKIGVTFGSPYTTTGGNALKFYASQRMMVSRIGAVKKGDEAIGNHTRVKVAKNKLAPPFREAEFDIIYGKGIEPYGEMLDLAVDMGIVDKEGAWFSYDDERIAYGRPKVLAALAEDKSLSDEIRQLVLDNLYPPHDQDKDEVPV